MRWQRNTHATRVLDFCHASHLEQIKKVLRVLDEEIAIEVRETV